MAPDRTMVPHSSHPEGLIILGRPNARCPWTFPVKPWVNGGDGRVGPERAYRGEKGDY